MRSQLSPPVEGSAHGDLVGEFELAAMGDATRDPGDPDPARSEDLCDVERRRFALDAQRSGDDDLHDPFLLRPRDQSVERKLLWADPVQRREESVEHMVAPAEGRAALDGAEVGYPGDHTEDPLIASRVPADAALLCRTEIAAARTPPDPRMNFREALAQGVREGGLSREHVVRESGSRPLSDAGETGEELYQLRDRIFALQVR